MQEKRRYVRWNISKKVKYRLESSQEELECLSRDISLRGVQLLLDRKIELHTILELAIEIPDSSNLIFARAEVIWQKKFEE